MVECKLSLELTKNGVQKSVHAKMGEKDSRKLLVTLTEKGKVFDLEGYEARVSYDDKTYTKATIDGNVVEFILPSTLLSGPGERLCELEISVPGESVLYSPMFVVNIEGSLGAEAKNEAVGKGVEYQQVIPDLEETADMGEETYIAVYEEGKGVKKYKVKGLGGGTVNVSALAPQIVATLLTTSRTPAVLEEPDVASMDTSQFFEKLSMLPDADGMLIYAPGKRGTLQVFDVGFDYSLYGLTVEESGLYVFKCDIPNGGMMQVATAYGETIRQVLIQGIESLTFKYLSEVGTAIK